jgi:CubicO group peptidase (beta-lactamase class C family)
MENVVKGLSTLPLAFQPGSHWRYSMSIDVIGCLVEIISGMPLDKFFKERIFEPLGMVDTDFYVPPEKEHRLAALYGHSREEPGPLMRREDHTPRQRPVYLSGGGLVSTLGDYIRFAGMLTGRGMLDGVRLLSPSTVKLFTINHTPLEALPYGFAANDLYHAAWLQPGHRV